MTIQRPRQPKNDQTGEDITATEPETPNYLVPVLVAFDDLNDAARHERVTALYCQGYRTAAIATMLDIPVRTVSRYIKDARYLLASESRASRDELLLRAVESARALAAEAWAAYERDCQLQREILAGQHDRLRRRVTRLGRPSRRPSTALVESSDTEAPLFAHGEGAGGEVPDGDLLYEEYERPRCASQAARLLAVALAAQHEVNRLQGLYEHVAPARQPVDINITGPLPDGVAPAGPSSSESAQPNPAAAERHDTDSSDAGSVASPASTVSRSVSEPARTEETDHEETDHQEAERTRRAAAGLEENLSWPPHLSPSPQQGKPEHAFVGTSGPLPSGTVPAETTEDESSFRKEIPIAENSATFGHVSSTEG